MSEMLKKDEFLERNNISKASFQASHCRWEQLTAIYDNYQKHIAEYQKKGEEFIEDYLAGDTTIKAPGIHSISFRVKDPEHLIEKIIRRSQTNVDKYDGVNAENYRAIVTDIIGIRCLMLFKEDWRKFHSYITGIIKDDPKLYVDYGELLKIGIEGLSLETFMAEPPKVYIRTGDEDIYEPEFANHIDDGKIYRSLHYIICYKGVFIEIQVRTLFEEGWAEIDHALVYPNHKATELDRKLTRILSRATGLADEIGSVFKEIKNPKGHITVDDEEGSITEEKSVVEKTNSIGYTMNVTRNASKIPSNGATIVDNIISE